MCQKYKWDFKNIYQNIDEWKKDLNTIELITKEIVLLKGQLKQEEQFIKYVKLTEKINKKAHRLGIYLHLLDIDNTDQNLMILSSLFSNSINEISKKLNFVDPELKAIKQDLIISYLKNNNLKQYIKSYNNFFKNKKHILSLDKESLLLNTQKTRSFGYDIYSSLVFADKEKDYIQYKNEKRELDVTLYMEIITKTDPIKDQKLRIKASKIFSQNIVNKKHSLSKVYESIINFSIEECNIREYKSFYEYYTNADNFKLEMYKNLINISKNNKHIYHDYLKLLKKYFKLDNFYTTDQYLKMGNLSNEKISIEQGKQMVREALSFLGDEYLSNLETAWDDNKIDFLPSTNKRDGAYSSGGDGVNPIILMNWDYQFNSVNTLAHEIGHSVHTLFADQNNLHPLNNYPIILAEVASTINEKILFEYFYKKSKNKENKIFLLQNQISNIIGTFFRQIQFADFEYQSHKLINENNPINTDTFANLFETISKEHGYNFFDKYSDKLNYGWPRISHFFNSPFYVYKYATCIVGAYKIYDQIQKNGAEVLIKFLKAGGYKEPLEILKDFQVDYTKNETYTPLLEELKELINRLKNLIE